MRLAAMVLVNLPLAMIGGVVSIWFTSGVVSIPSIIGFISLLGIAVRNGILLVSHYEQLRAEGMSLYDSVIRGSLDRLNPILMTSLTSALALIPLALGGDVPGNEIQSPMAQVILGGLISVFFPFLDLVGLAGRIQLLKEVYPYIAVAILIIYGLFAGIFVGCLALAIAEMLDSIPIFSRRMKFRHGVGVVILCMAIGKTVGSLIYFGKEFFP